MTSILSSISGYFSKSLILGAFLPVAIFTVLALILLVPHLPPNFVVSLPLEGLDKEWKVVGVSFVVVVTSGLLYNLNIPILRLYQGYPWQTSWIGLWLTKRHRVRFDTAQLRVDSMRAALRTMEAATQKDPADSSFIQEVIENWKALGGYRAPAGLGQSRWLQAWRESHQQDEAEEIREYWQAIYRDLLGEFSVYRVQVKHAYPDNRNLILPTRLGNVIRSFEYYSHREYGIDSIEIWPRLVAVIPTDYAVSIDDTKTTFDFMMNCSLLCSLLSFLILLAGLIYPTPLVSTPIAVYWLIKVVSLALLSYFFYRLSINRAHAWGLLIKSAFDLYRWDLLKKLGYEQQPKQRQDERTLWTEISRQTIYGDRFDKKLLNYAVPAATFPNVQSNPAHPGLEITRGVKAGATTDSLTIYLRVKNPDSVKTATGVTIRDRLPEDLDFEWDSARVNSRAIPMSGTNPYEFQLGELQPNGETVLSYAALKKIHKNERTVNYGK